MLAQAIAGNNVIPRKLNGWDLDWLTFSDLNEVTNDSVVGVGKSLYGDFAFIQSVIESYMYDVRGKEAQHSFHKAYDALSDSQKQQVNEAHPLRMIEIP